MLDIIVNVAAAAIFVAAAVFDTRTKKIPNFITFPAMLAGIGFTAVSGGWKKLVILIVSFVLLYLLSFAKKMFGYGDIKLLMAACALCGPICTAAAFLIANVGIVIRHIWNIKQHKRVAFAPYFAAGYIITLVFKAVILWM